MYLLWGCHGVLLALKLSISTSPAVLNLRWLCICLALTFQIITYYEFAMMYYLLLLWDFYVIQLTITYTFYSMLLAVLTLRLLASSLFLIQLSACCCGSMQRGNLEERVVSIPFWMDSSSGGRLSDVHLKIVESGQKSHNQQTCLQYIHVIKLCHYSFIHVLVKKTRMKTSLKRLAQNRTKCCNS